MAKDVKIIRISAILVLIYFCWHIMYSQWSVPLYKGLLPESIRVSEVIESGSDHGCGGAVFRLSPLALDNIRRSSINAFVDAKQARNYTNSNDRQFDYYTYSAWKETPTPDINNLTSLQGLSCASFSLALQRDIEKSLKTSGSYFSTTQEGILIIIPTLGLAVISYFT